MTKRGIVRRLMKLLADAIRAIAVALSAKA